MTDEERFYLERDRRTREYGVLTGLDLPVRVVVGRDAAHSARGQAAVLALINMLARLHRQLHLDIPAAPLLTPCIIPANRFDDAAVALARCIDPFIRINSGAASANAIGIGAEAPAGLPWYAGADGQIAIIDRTPVPIDAGDSLSLGTALMACLAASALLNQALGFVQRPVRLSAWNLREGHEAARGPDRLGRIDVGNVLQVGAGGVGSCLAYWLREFGVLGTWYILDGDFAILHNTNRCLGLFPSDAGWPAGESRNKAIAAAALIGASGKPVWYDQFDHESFTPDLILPLANERSARHYAASRGEPLMLHATTSRGWEAQLHRHIAGTDDCITCRMPPYRTQVQFACAEAPLAPGGNASTDAALPFLSATAGLLLASGLYRLQLRELASDRHNFWAVCYRDARRHARPAIYACGQGCNVTLPPQVRVKIHAGRRWSHLDAAPRADCELPS